MRNRDFQSPAPDPRNARGDETSSVRSNDERWLRLAAQQVISSLDLLLQEAQVASVAERESEPVPRKTTMLQGKPFARKDAKAQRCSFGLALRPGAFARKTL